MRVLDLFSGTGSATQAFTDRGHEVFHVDDDPALSPDLVADIGALKSRDLPGPWHFVWASPPCQCFSVASIYRHWREGTDGLVPKSTEAVLAERLVAHTIRLIESTGAPYWLMENPRAALRKSPVVTRLPRVTVTYCQYGDKRQKPTDLWGYPPPSMMFRPPCSPGAPCHEAAPRGSRTGTQGLKNAKERGRVPYELSMELCLAMEKAMEVAA